MINWNKTFVFRSSGTFLELVDEMEETLQQKELEWIPTRSMITLVFLTALGWCCLWYNDRRLGPAGEPQPPEPWAWPLLGHIPFLLPVPFRAMTRMRQKYGDVIQLRMGRKKFVALNGFSVMKEALLGRAHAFSGRPDMLAFRHIAHGKSISFNSASETWTAKKRSAVAAVVELVRREPELLKKFIRCQIRRVGDRLCEETAQDGVTRPLLTITREVTKLGLMEIFGPLPNIDDVYGSLRDTLERFMKIVPLISLIDFGLAPFWLLSGQVKRMVEINDAVSSYVRGLVTSSLAEPENSYILQCVNNRYDKLRDEVKNLVSRHDFLYVIEDLVGASAETTSDYLAWLIVYLAKHPDMQEEMSRKLREAESREGYDPNIPIPFVRSFVLEVSRHGSFSAMTIPHETLDDVVIQGWFIPKGTMVIANLHSVYRDPEVFVDPEKFDPGRFLTPSGGLNVQLAARMVMYGMGRRRCAGAALAELRLYQSTVILLREYRFTEDPKKPLNLEEGAFNVTFRPAAYQVMAESRG